MWFKQGCRTENNCNELNFVPSKDMFQSQALVQVNVAVLGNRVFVDIIKM